MTSALSVIPQGASLVEREPQVVAWIEDQTDAQALRDAQALLAAWRTHAERGSVEADAAIRLDVRCIRRLGQLPEVAPRRPGPTAEFVTAGDEPRTGAERMALSRARAIAAIPRDRFEEVLAEPKPSQAKLLATAIVPEPAVDPANDEAIRVHRLMHQPATETWPHMFDLELLNEGAVATIREALESWERWCVRWSEALDATRPIRRVK